jgi:hypothetical protein
MTKLFTYYLVVVSAVLCCSAAATQAQTDRSRFEIGVHYTTLQVSEKNDHDGGPGLRFTYNLNEYIGIEAEGNMLPQTREGGGNNETQGFFGVRAGIHKEKFGVFAKARPGFTTFNLLGINPGVNTFEQGHTRFAMDVGGVFEYYPTQHVSLRVDAGDTMIQYKPGDFFYQRLDEPNPVSKELSHNLQITVGVAYRF